MEVKGICCSYQKDLNGHEVLRSGVVLRSPIAITFNSKPVGSAHRISTQDDGVVFEGKIFDPTIVESLSSIPKEFWPVPCAAGVIKGRDDADYSRVTAFEITDIMLSFSSSDKGIRWF